MPVKVNCPECSKELNAPDSLIGKLAACPRCSTKFPIQPNGHAVAATAEPPASSASHFYPPGVEPPPSAADLPSVATPVAPPAGSLQTTIDKPNTAVRLTPPVATPPEATSPETPPVANVAVPVAQPKTATPIQQPPPVAGVPVPPGGNVAKPMEPPVSAPPVSSPSSDPPAQEEAASSSPLQKPSERRVRSAKFVSGGALTTRINLGEDGKLPDLVVDEDAEKAEKQPEEGQESGNPMIMAVALCVSVVMSILMLFIPTDEAEQKSRSKARARMLLEKHYIGSGPTFKPHEKLLRDALVASRHGNEASAKRRYRKVLDMLHAEDNGGKDYLIRPRSVSDPPSDVHLEEQLGILLSDR